jgi:ribonuclease VapC
VRETYILDSFAVLALLGREPGSDSVASLLRRAEEGRARVLMTWVNAGEVAYIVERRWGAGRMYAALAALEASALELVVVDRELTLWAAHVKAEHPLAYADAFAAALARQAAATLVTGDPEFDLLEETLDIEWLPRREP